jgi:hypothetical protein
VVKTQRMADGRLALARCATAWLTIVLTIGLPAKASDVHDVTRTDAVQAGLYRCHQGAQIIVKNIAPDRGSIVIQFKGKDHLLFAVDTATGAVRYQDNRSGITWIKIPSKSMLLDSKLGLQLANDCKL